MKAETYLLQYRDSKLAIGRLLDQMNQLEQERDSISVNLSGMPSGSTVSSKVENIAVMISDLKRDIARKYEELLLVRKDIIINIDKVDDELEKEVLYRRYIIKQPYRCICEELNYSYQYIQKVRVRGIASLQVILDRRDVNE